MSFCSVHMWFLFPVFALTMYLMPLLCPGTVVGKLLCELKSPGKLVSVALHLYSPVVLIRWISPGMCKPDGLAESHRPDLEFGLGPVLFLILLGPADLAPACCPTPCVLDGFSAFALFISPQKESSSVCRA